MFFLTSNKPLLHRTFFGMLVSVSLPSSTRITLNMMVVGAGKDTQSSRMRSNLIRWDTRYVQPTARIVGPFGAFGPNERIFIGNFVWISFQPEQRCALYLWMLDEKEDDMWNQEPVNPIIRQMSFLVSSVCHPGNALQSLPGITARNDDVFRIGCRYSGEEDTWTSSIVETKIRSKLECQCVRSNVYMKMMASVCRKSIMTSARLS